MKCQNCNPDKINYKDCGKCVRFQTKISQLENECKLREMFYCGRCSDKCLTLDEMKTCENVKDIRKFYADIIENTQKKWKSHIEEVQNDKEMCVAQ